MDDKPIPSQDDKIIGAIAHAAALMPMWGIVAPALIWLTQREKSEYIRQQAAQALAWQALQIVLLFAVYLPGVLLVFSLEMSTTPLVDIVLQICGFSIIILFGFGPLIMGIYAAVRNLQGRNFNYPFIGQRIRNYLSQ